MDTQYLNQCIKNIQVQNVDNADVEVINNSPLVMIGKGRQGAVFQLSDDICVKVFGNTEDCEREYYALSLGQHTTLFPKVYANGPLYIAMEIIKGVDVREYLQSQPLTKELSTKLIEMLITFKEIGFERIDHHKRQIYLLQDGSLKVIDVARTVWRDRVYPYPRKLLTSLGEENKELFLSHVQELAPELYGEWMHYIRMEEISREVYQVLMSEPKNTNAVKTLNKRLLTTKDENNYVVQLEGLVHKVFKEEWVKTMLARGVDPDTVMGKIDEYWDYHEQAWESVLEKGGHSEKDKQKKGTKNEKSTKSKKTELLNNYWDFLEKGKQSEKDKKQDKDKQQKRTKTEQNQTTKKDKNQGKSNNNKGQKRDKDK
ncbi:RIO2 family protein [Peribacillus butanolivorans]|uniref:hypothetical protein n=1 Tax=Peribacillus butanolivorans TaxID=421767 RepID=UPI00070963E7|nr:hypothetical protein ASG99_12080 [Bacillus sp. Soil768D1]